MGAPPIAVELSARTPPWAIFSAQERLTLASSCRWVRKASLASDDAEEEEALPIPGEAQARHRTFAAASAAIGAGPLFDVEAEQRPASPVLTERLAIPTGRIFAQFAAQNLQLNSCLPGLPAGDGTAGTVYVHGVWDLLSAGDIEFLKAAKAMGARLVVGVLGDDEVCRIMSSNSRRLAGQRPFDPFLTAVPSDHHFPVHSLAERALALMACKYVDDVILGAPALPDEAFLAANAVQCFAVDPREHGEIFSLPPETSQSADRLGLSQELPEELASITTTKDILQRVLDTHEEWLASSAGAST